MGARRPVITLTTDFGTRDPFIGQMKGVILNINPDAEIVDISNEISPHNIREGAVVAGLSYRYFPNRTIHIVVVDPGVGSCRKPLIVTTENHYFVGPDNGVLSMVYSLEREHIQVTHITADHYFLNKDSATFHGRDIFAPVAAWLSKGIQVRNFGELVTEYMRIRIPEPERPTKNTIEGEIIHIDRFGNAITNIKGELIAPPDNSGNRARIVIKGKESVLKQHYSEAEDRELYCLINSFGLLEFFTYCSNASELYNLQVGDMVGIIRM